jgi:acetylglutamate kinase
VTPADVVVVKFGGELLEDADELRAVCASIARTTSSSSVHLVVVHGAGRAIDAMLSAAGIEKHQVEGLRITDAPTLSIVVGVLAGTVNTRFVAALVSMGVRAVGLTGADTGCGRAEIAPAHRMVDGREIDLGLVGVPKDGADVNLVEKLARDGFVPVLASIGADDRGQLLNVNADTFAGHLASSLRAGRLVFVGTTAGVLDSDGATVPRLDTAAIDRLVNEKTATAGMVAKLRAAQQALDAGVTEVLIVNGRDREALEAATLGDRPRSATRLLAGVGGAARTP